MKVLLATRYLGVQEIVRRVVSLHIGYKWP